MTEALADRLGRILHDRAHRHDGGGINCVDPDLPPGHPPCYLIAAEIVDSLPSRATDRSREFREGRAAGADQVLGSLIAWVDNWVNPGPTAGGATADHGPPAGRALAHPARPGRALILAALWQLQRCQSTTPEAAFVPGAGTRAGRRSTGGVRLEWISGRGQLCPPAARSAGRTRPDPRRFPGPHPRQRAHQRPRPEPDAGRQGTLLIILGARISFYLPGNPSCRSRCRPSASSSPAPCSAPGAGRGGHPVPRAGHHRAAGLRLGRRLGVHRSGLATIIARPRASGCSAPRAAT